MSTSCARPARCWPSADGVQVAEAHAGDDAVIVLDHTPFYAESGGQAGDSAMRNASTGQGSVVDDTTRC